ncbi:MAG TPA: helix-turn-helix transcriptional regulator [Thermoanaerobaculia bacterium]
MTQPEAELFGARLRELREGRGESQRSLAALTGITYAYISEMERGLKVPSLTTIIRLAVALECEVVELVDVFTGRDLRKLVPKRE